MPPYAAADAADIAFCCFFMPLLLRFHYARRCLFTMLFRALMLLCRHVCLFFAPMSCQDMLRHNAAADALFFAMIFRCFTLSFSLCRYAIAATRERC